MELKPRPYYRGKTNHAFETSTRKNSVPKKGLEECPNSQATIDYHLERMAGSKSCDYVSEFSAKHCRGSETSRSTIWRVFPKNLFLLIQHVIDKEMVCLGGTVEGESTAFGHVERVRALPSETKLCLGSSSITRGRRCAPRHRHEWISLDTSE